MRLTTGRDMIDHTTAATRLYSVAGAMRAAHTNDPTQTLGAVLARALRSDNQKDPAEFYRRVQLLQLLPSQVRAAAALVMDEEESMLLGGVATMEAKLLGFDNFTAPTDAPYVLVSEVTLAELRMSAYLFEKYPQTHEANPDPVSLVELGPLMDALDASVGEDIGPALSGSILSFTQSTRLAIADLFLTGPDPLVACVHRFEGAVALRSDAIVEGSGNLPGKASVLEECWHLVERIALLVSPTRPALSGPLSVAGPSIVLAHELESRADQAASDFFEADDPE